MSRIILAVFLFVVSFGCWAEFGVLELNGSTSKPQHLIRPIEEFKRTNSSALVYFLSTSETKNYVDTVTSAAIGQNKQDVSVMVKNILSGVQDFSKILQENPEFQKFLDERIRQIVREEILKLK